MNGSINKRANFIRYSYIENMDNNLLAFENKISNNGIDVKWISNEEELVTFIRQSFPKAHFNKVCFDLPQVPDELFDSSNLINQVFKACLTYGIDIGQYLEKENCIKTGKYINEEKLTGYDHDFDIKCTSFPKQEVAYGLVCDKVIQDKTERKAGLDKAVNASISNPFNHLGAADKLTQNAGAEKTIIAGEDFVLEGVQKNGIEGILPEYILKKIEVSREFRVFNAFVSKFNEQASALDLPEIVLEKRDFNNIWAAVNQELIEKNTNSGGSAKNVEVEPLFIMILRNTLHMI